MEIISERLLITDWQEAADKIPSKREKKRKNDISCNSCGRRRWEERRGGEQLTRSDTGKER